MKKYPAFALLEFSRIATGIFAGDAMLKQAPISLLKLGTVHPGKHLIMIGGSVAAVEEAYLEGIKKGADQVIDSVMLPNIHRVVYDAVLGARSKCSDEALAVIETSTVSAAIKSADAGIKGAEVDIVEIRLADDIGGKALTIFTGKLEEVETAVEISKEAVLNSNCWLEETIIPRLHADMMKRINSASTFSAMNIHRLESGEI